MNADLARDFTQHASTKLREQLGQITRCAELLSPAEIWHRANAHTNSVGNLILHLTGNMRQWLIAGLHGAAFARDRPAEFAERGPLPTATILAGLTQAVTDGLAVLARADGPALAARYVIQGYDVSGLVAVTHVVEHFSAHTAQIVHMTKVFKDVDLSLYDAQGHKLAGQPPAP
ncbi:MAG TPA: DUF1572 family protein [Phycisphaerae bacterium]|nr:DUF1572 family protein [Phycisphaerae bacterium]